MNTIDRSPPPVAGAAPYVSPVPPPSHGYSGQPYYFYPPPAGYGANHYRPPRFRYPAGYYITRFLYTYGSLFRILRTVAFLYAAALFFKPDLLLHLPELWRMPLAWLSFGVVILSIIFSGWALLFAGLRLSVSVGIAFLLGSTLFGGDGRAPGVQLPGPVAKPEVVGVAENLSPAPPPGFVPIQFDDYAPPAAAGARAFRRRRFVQPVQEERVIGLSAEDIEAIRKRYAALPMLHTGPQSWEIPRAHDEMYFGSRPQGDGMSLDSSDPSVVGQLESGAEDVVDSIVRYVPSLRGILKNQ